VRWRDDLIIAASIAMCILFWWGLEETMAKHFSSINGRKTVD